MNQVSWLGFGIASTVTKTFVHFLPAAAGIGAPYHVDLKVTVGGSSLPRRTFSVDGAKLGYPDGFRLEEAVTALSQQVSGLYLIKVDLFPTQQRVDLANSCILIELQYQQASVRYLPRRINSRISGLDNVKAKVSKSRHDVPEHLGTVMSRGIFNPDVSDATAFAIRDSTLFASIVILNSSSSPIVARIFSSRMEDAVGSITVNPDSVKECDLVDLGLTHSSKLDSTWGSIEVEAFRVSFEPDARAEVEDGKSPIVNQTKESNSSLMDRNLGAAAAAYVVYRDRNSRRISSVVAV